jgi:hypothetical protein
MATRFAKEFIAWTAMDPQRNLVGHGSAWHKNRSFFSEQTGNAILKGYDRWVDVDDVIPDRCSQHCGPHAFRRSRYGIAAQIDKLHIRFKHFVSGPRNSTSGVLLESTKAYYIDSLSTAPIVQSTGKLHE